MKGKDSNGSRTNCLRQQAYCGYTCLYLGADGTVLTRADMFCVRDNKKAGEKQDGCYKKRRQPCINSFIVSKNFHFLSSFLSLFIFAAPAVTIQNHMAFIQLKSMFFTDMPE